MDVAAAVLVTLATVVLAFAGLVFVSRRLFVDPLDRVAASLLAVAAVTFGVFALGSLTASMPTPLLNLLLLANPLVAVASAARIDIFHEPWLYDLSPIAHREFQYPAWQLAAALYGCVAVAALLAARAPNGGRINGSTH